jgi:nicotinamide-nucleotide amidase
VGDNEGEITAALKQALERADCVILTGGLGPTHDDITKSVLARFFNSKLVTDAKVKRRIDIIFQSRGKETPVTAYSQAEVPEKATILHNTQGTAPGLLFEKNGKRIYSLPGVPLEAEHLLETYIVPQLESLGTMKVEHRILKTTGIPESVLWEEIGSVAPFEEHVKVASLPSPLGVRIRFTATGKDLKETTAKLDTAEKLLRQKIDHHIFAVDDEILEGIIGELLKENNWTLAVAESCTGGLIGHRLTNVSGSSDYFLEGAVIYSNAAKQSRLGVDPALIKTHGAVSPEVATAMAEGISQKSGSDFGLAVTGIAGPTGGTPDKPVGLTYIAVTGTDGTRCEKFLFHQDRVRNKERAAQAALNLLRLYLLDES